MVKSGDKVCLLIVTYGDRWSFLQQVLIRLLTLAQVNKIVIVNNASVYNVSERVRIISDPRIFVINSLKNKGSAGGYKEALKYAFEKTDCDFFWLLDDDNLPEKNCLSDLLNEWKAVNGDDEKKAFFCLREDRTSHIRIAQGHNPYRYYLVKDNFLGFNIFRILSNQFDKLFDKTNKNKPYKSRVAIPYVPYGGLFINRSIISNIGYPNEELFLYVDDSEYTYRITQNGGTIWLIPSCKVIDIDKSQGLNYKRNFFRSPLLDLWNFRTYYHVRNRMFFYSNTFIRNRMLFKINKFLYLTYLKIIALLSSKQAEYNKLVKAVNDGLSGKLGEADLSNF